MCSGVYLRCPLAWQFVLVPRLWPGCWQVRILIPKRNQPFLRRSTEGLVAVRLIPGLASFPTAPFRYREPLRYAPLRLALERIAFAPFRRPETRETGSEPCVKKELPHHKEIAAV